MQILVLQPRENGKYYPNYDEMIKNASDEDERNYLIHVKERCEEWKRKGFDDGGFAFGIIYTSKQACGHYEIFQHPIYREYGKEPTEDDILSSIEDIIQTIRITKNRKCTHCICG